MRYINFLRIICGANGTILFDIVYTKKKTDARNVDQMRNKRLAFRGRSQTKIANTERNYENCLENGKT